MVKVATDFEKIIKEGRERKKNEVLAQRIFSKDRRQSAPTTFKAGPGPSLASRVGVKKRVTSLGPKAPITKGNINAEWAHDLHRAVNDDVRVSNSLAARISAPGSRNVARRANRIAAALEQAETKAEVAQQVNLRSSSAVAKGLSIRGLAGPFAVMAQNFAPGTTAADIESAMTPVGGEMISCEILKTSPMIVAEMVFSSKEGGEYVIDTFNNQTADGRIIKVYPKPGGYRGAIGQADKAPSTVPTGPRAQRTTRSTVEQVVDGSMGFRDLMDTGSAKSATGGGALYSDTLVGQSRRGRGFRGGKPDR